MPPEITQAHTVRGSLHVWGLVLYSYKRLAPKPPNLIHLLSTVFRHLIDAYSCNISFGGREVGSSGQTNSHHVQGRFSEAYVAIAWQLFLQRMVAATPTALGWQNTPAPTHAFLSLTEAHSDTAARSLP